MKPNALGLPDRGHTPKIRKVTKPESWEFVIQKHEAKKAGLHYDVRLGDPTTGHGHSWATRELPTPGNKTLAKRQPNHTLDYFDYQGTIPAGYGAGRVTTHHRSKADVLEANDDWIRFQTLNGRGVNEYAMVHTGDGNWLLINKKPFLSIENHPITKPQMKSKERDQIDYTDSSKILTAKIDGANSTLFLHKDSFPKVYSHRVSKRDKQQIEYTPKIESLMGKRVPKSFGKTVLQGEVFVDTKKGPAPARITAAALNSNVENSRNLQKQHGKLKIALFNVEKYKNKDVSKLPYAQKLEILKDVAKEYPDTFVLPDHAITAKRKQALVKKILHRKHKQTMEGVVEWGDNQPTKVKFHNIDDAYVVGIAPGTGKYKGKGGGALIYSNKPGGAPIGNVGTGFSDEERYDMVNNPKNWVGKKIVIKHMGKMPSGAFFHPAYEGEHVD